VGHSQLLGLSEGWEHRQSVLQEALLAFIQGTVKLGEKCHVADF